MKNLKSSIVVTGLLRAFALAMTVVAVIFQSSFAFASECKVTILHFNDFHGYLATTKEKLGGAERLAALVAKIDTENELVGRHTVLLMGGDLISGTAVSEAFKGEAEFKFLKAIGTEAVVIGNHDFDFGIAALEKNMRESDIPVLSANISRASGGAFAEATYIFPLADDCRLGVMGLTIANTPRMSGTDLSALKFADPIATASDYIDDLVNQSEIRVALTHLDRKEDIELAKKVHGFNVIIGGHDHISPDEYCVESGGIPACETPSKGHYLGRIDISVVNGKAVVENKALIPVDKKAGKSKEVRGILAPYLTAVDNVMAANVGTLERSLEYSTKGKVAPSELCAAFSDAVRNFAKTDIAVTNVGGCRKSLSKGLVTREDIFESFPFGNEIVTSSMTGSEIVSLIETSERVARPERPQPFLCWSGLNYSKSGNKYSVKVSGSPLEMSKGYTFATINFLAKGGDLYSALNGKKYKKTGKIDRDVFAMYLKKQ